MPRTFVFAILVLATSAAAQTTVNLTPSKDNTLYFDLAGSVSNGSGSSFFVGTTAGGLRQRAVMAFDVAAAVPAGARIVDVQLALFLSRTSATAPMNVGLHRLLADWGEGASVGFGGGGGGAPSQPGDATWVHRMYPNVLWANPGGDFDPNPSGSSSVPATIGSTAIWSSTPGMVADVQSWLDTPSGNFGWLLLSPETGFATSRRFDSREALLPSSRPVLRVRYDPPAAAGVTAVGVGCGTSSSTVMTLAAPTAPVLGNAAFTFVITMGPPALPAVHLLSWGTATRPVAVAPNCLFHLQPLFQVGFPGRGPFLLDGLGGDTLAAPVPNFPALAGSNFGIQSLALDPGLPQGFVLSNALQVQLGF